MVRTCDGHRVLLHAPIEITSQWFLLGVLVQGNTNVSPVFPIAAVACVAELDWTANESQEWSVYNQKDGAFVASPALALISCRNTADVEVAENA